jgi:hypothetical protein
MDDDFEDFEDFQDDESEICEGCGEPYGDGCCPFCCPNGGMYAPGTEDCDFCDYASECLSNARRAAKRGKR